MDETNYDVVLIQTEIYILLKAITLTLIQPRVKV